MLFNEKIFNKIVESRKLGKNKIKILKNIIDNVDDINCNGKPELFEIIQNSFETSQKKLYYAFSNYCSEIGVKTI
jgi:hypothetical protein